MATQRKSAEKKPSRRPALTPEGRESQLVSLAVNLAEKQMADGTASAQVITHYLKLASIRNGLEEERLRNENALLRAKIEALESSKNVEALYADAIQAMRRYSGDDSGDDHEN